ncbi:MAG TPA: hypothetical protein VHS56_03370 [Candidatus Cybelea sp.]|jgi:hypothetical protein|nr:hypothetical protein [Candidatus Cybelea sp.]
MTALVAAGVLACVLAVAHARAATAYTAPDIQTTTRDHMQMTLHAPQQPGDSTRADAIVAAARRVMAEYPTVEAAEKAGFKKFLPKIPLPIEHYTNRSYAVEAYIGEFDPMHPTSLIFKRSPDALQIVGVMYTASNSADRDVLDSRVPLSYGTWHRHVDFCKAPPGTPLADRMGPGALFGFKGSIETKDACMKAGGTFIPIVFGWMVHVWPNEKTRAGIWAVDAHDSMSMSVHDSM